MMRRVLLVLLLISVGCIKAPEIIVVDQATALEQQAGGTFKELEEELIASAATVGPVPLTPNELEALGIKPRPLVDQTEQTEADRLDELLVQRCVGEGRDGLLVDTQDDCLGGVDRSAIVALVERTNRARMQLFRWLHAQRPERSMAEIKRAWRAEHLKGVVCGGWVERPEGGWEAKSC